MLRLCSLFMICWHSTGSVYQQQQQQQHQMQTAGRLVCAKATACCCGYRGIWEAVEPVKACCTFPACSGLRGTSFQVVPSRSLYLLLNQSQACCMQRRVKVSMSAQSNASRRVSLIEELGIAGRQRVNRFQHFSQAS